MENEEPKMFEELTKKERIETVEKFMLNEVAVIYQGLQFQGYQEVTFSDVLKAYEILFKNGKEK